MQEEEATRNRFKGEYKQASKASLAPHRSLARLFEATSLGPILLIAMPDKISTRKHCQLRFQQYTKQCKLEKLLQLCGMSIRFRERPRHYYKPSQASGACHRSQGRWQRGRRRGSLRVRRVRAALEASGARTRRIALYVFV